MHHLPSPIAVRAGLFAVLFGGLTLACAQSDVAGPEQPALEARVTRLAPDFVKCGPVPGASASKLVSPGVWDTLRVGPHKLIFEPGSLRQETLITAEFDRDSVRSIQFGPEGLRFRHGHEPTLQMSVHGCGQLNGTMRIVYAKDDLSGVKEALSSLLDVDAEKVTAPIKHFSRYAVHY
jgi:hypothetical protein